MSKGYYPVSLITESKKVNIMIDPSKEFKLTDKKELPKKKKGK